MAYSDKVWKDSPDHTTPLSAAGLNDWEARIKAETDALEVLAVAKGSLTLNVKDYGATGDGATDDTTVIQAALTAAAGLGGAVVLFPPGVYLISSTLTVSSNTTVDGSGRRAIIRVKANPGSSRDGRILAVAAADSTDVTIRNITLDGNCRVGNVPGGALNYATSSFHGGLVHGHNNTLRLQVLNCRLVNAIDYFIAASATVGSMSTDWRIEGNDCDGSGMSGSSAPGIFLTNVQRVHVRGNTVRNTGDDCIAFVSPRGYNSGDPTVAYCSDYEVSGNVLDTIKVNGSCIAVTGARFSVVGNVCKGSATDGTIRARHSDVDPDEFLARDFVIADNVIESSGAIGINLSATRGTVRGNRINTTVGDGIRIADSATAAASGTADAFPTVPGTLTVENNEVIAAGGSGVLLQATKLQRVIVRQNRALDSAEYGLRLEPPTTSGRMKLLSVEDNLAVGSVGGGIRLAQGTGRCDRLTARGNQATDNTGAGIQVVSGAVVATRFDLIDNISDGNTGSNWDINATPTSEYGNVNRNPAVILGDNAAISGMGGLPGISGPTGDWAFTAPPGTANRLNISRIRTGGRAVVMADIAFVVTNAAGADDSCDVGVYDTSGNRLASSGATSGKLNGTGRKSIACSYTLAANTTYYLAFIYGAAGGTAARLASGDYGNGSLTEVFGGSLGTYHAAIADAAGTTLPTTLPTMSTTSTTAYPILAARE